MSLLVDPANSLPARDFDRPVPGRLVVRLNNGDEHYATPEDLARWGYVDASTAYGLFRRALQVALEAWGEHPESGDLTDSRLNPIRYLAEYVLMFPDELAPIYRFNLGGEHRDPAEALGVTLDSELIRMLHAVAQVARKLREHENDADRREAEELAR